LKSVIGASTLEQIVNERFALVLGQLIPVEAALSTQTPQLRFGIRHALVAPCLGGLGQHE
jgi:hypothetical protein